MVVVDVIVEEEEEKWRLSFTLSTRNDDSCGGPRRDDNGTRTTGCKRARLTARSSRASRAFVDWTGAADADTDVEETEEERAETVRRGDVVE